MNSIRAMRLCGVLWLCVVACGHDTPPLPAPTEPDAGTPRFSCDAGCIVPAFMIGTYVGTLAAIRDKAVSVEILPGPDEHTLTARGFCPDPSEVITLHWNDASASAVLQAVYVCAPAPWTCPRADFLYFDMSISDGQDMIHMRANGAVQFDDLDPATATPCDVPAQQASFSMDGVRG